MLANRDSPPLKSRFETETTPMQSELGYSCVYCDHCKRKWGDHGLLNHCLSFSFHFILLFSYSGLIGVEETVERSYCQTMNERNKVISILALAEKAGMSTGFISTARATHATPACLYAHSADRDFESDKDLKSDAKDDPSNCTDIGRCHPRGFSQIKSSEGASRKRTPPPTPERWWFFFFFFFGGGGWLEFFSNLWEVTVLKQEINCHWLFSAQSSTKNTSVLLILDSNPGVGHAYLQMWYDDLVL